MPYAIPSKLNCSTFFNFWAFKAFSKASITHLSKNDRAIAQLYAVLFGACTFGIGTWVCKACCKGKIDRTSDDGRVPAVFSRVQEDQGIRRAVREGDERVLTDLHRHYQVGFGKFREKYRLVKTIMEQEAIPNPFLLDDGLVFNNLMFEEVKYLAIASDYLDELEKENPVLAPFENRMNVMSHGYPHFLKAVAENCRVKDMPFLSRLDRVKSLTFLRYWIHHPERAKWEAALPLLWEKMYQIPSFNLAYGQTATLKYFLQSLCTPEKFKTAFESLLAFKYETTDVLPKVLISYDEYPHHLSVRKKMEIVKNTVWDKKCIRNDIVGPIVSCQKPLFDKIRTSLSLPWKTKNKCLQFTGLPSNLTLIPGDVLNLILKKINARNWHALCSVSKGHYQRFLSVIQALLPIYLNEALGIKIGDLSLLTLKELLEIKNSAELLEFEKRSMG